MQRLHIILLFMILFTVGLVVGIKYPDSRLYLQLINTYIFQETDSYFDSWKIVADSGTLPEPEKYDTIQRAD